MLSPDAESTVEMTLTGRDVTSQQQITVKKPSASVPTRFILGADDNEYARSVKRPQLRVGVRGVLPRVVGDERCLSCAKR